MNAFDVTLDGIRYHLEPAPEGGYVASIPDLPGCLSEGESFEETLTNIQEALVLYVEGCLGEGLPIPERYRALLAQAP